WKVNFFLGTEHFNVFSHQGHPFTTLQLVNDALMAIFFFTVGLEIKREILVGELSSVKQAILPFIGACGGMIFPVLVFLVVGKLYNFSPEEFKGMAIPMATDIAFSIGVLSLLGKRVPLSLKIFLLALAIVDDIGGIVVIAIFYSHFSTASFIYLFISALLFGVLMLGNYWRVNSKLFYALVGIIIWYLFLQAGIHPTIAGVLVAFTIPARPHLNVQKFTQGIQHDINILRDSVSDDEVESIVLTNSQIKCLSRIEIASDHVISPLQDFEDNLVNLVNYFIMPLFAFANAGVVFDMSNLNIFSGVTLSVALGLLIGKVAGIFTFTWLAVKLKISRLSTGMTWINMLGLAMLGGIGFTVALFLAGLSYPLGSDLLNQAKLGVIIGSLFSGVIGYFMLKLILNKK
ncbi:MAG TPA: Na+/H+ antiporter NhaA, partial [Paludibacter sp.]|nr:Na+/H+ antiporter NhaA [Paludibacter sp.]